MTRSQKKKRIQSSNQDVSGLPTSPPRIQDVSDKSPTLASRIQDVTVGLPTSFKYRLRSFYVRDCYEEYYMRVMDLLNNDYDYISVTGTPGIGKSLFYDYFFARYRREHPNVLIVTASFNKDRQLEECVVFGPDGSSDIWDNTDFPNISKRIPNAIHLYDGPPSVKPARSKMVAFTSPSIGWLDSMIKNVAHSPLYMPVWEKEELNEAIESLQLEIVDPPLEERYELFGGIARYCLATNNAFYKKGVNHLLKGVNKIDKFEKLNKFIDDPESVADQKLVHRLFHYVPRADPLFETVVLGSEKIGLMLYEKLQKELDTDRKKLMQWLEGAGKASVLSGWLFENLAHEALLKGGSFTIRKLGTEGSFQDMLTVDRTVGDYERISSRVELKEVFRNVYLIPDAPNFKSIDSFKMDNGRLLLFQITRSAVHPVNSSGLVELFTKLKITETIEQNPTNAWMIFVVPKGMGEKYKKQGLTSTAGDNWSSADVTIVKGIGKNIKQKLNNMNIKTCEELIAKYTKDPQSISFVKAATEAFLHQVGAKYLDNIPQYVMELEE